MFKNGLLVGIILFVVSMTAGAAEVAIEFKQGKPSAKEFVLAAKRTYYKRNYKITSVTDDMVTGVVKKYIVMEIVLQDNAVIIRLNKESARDIEDSNNLKQKINGYLRNLQRDLVYELAEFIL